MALEILEMKQVVSILLFVIKQRAPIVMTARIRRDIQLHSSISMKHRFLGRAAISNKPREETYVRRAI